MSEVARPRVGDVLGNRFTLAERIGHGGMGAVFKAADTLTKEVVAVKVLESPDPDAGSRFRREANVLANLRHEGIVRYVAHRIAAGGPDGGGASWLAMEWLDGEDLGQRLRREGMPVAEALAMVRRAADAVGVAHAAGIVHRDLKPGNLFLVGGDPGKVKLIDFGIARLRTGISDLTSGATMAGTFLGTVGYLAPEQARGEPNVGPAADVFSLGVVLYHCVTGQRPFQGANPTAVLAKILFEDPPPARELRPELSPGLDDLLRRALAKKPGDRPPDGAALAREIDRLTDRGRAVTPGAALPALGAGEFRFVTVVVAAPLAVAAPSEVETVRLPRQAPVALEDLAARYGARLERLADGVVVAAIQVEATATDQASRAARFALALAKHWPGPVAMSSGRAEWVGRLPVGEAIDRALALAHARLRGDSGLGAVRVDELTASLLDVRFDVGGAAPVFKLVGERQAALASRTLLGRELPCVGRSAELAALQGLCARSAEESTAQAVLVVGPPGIGKSRVRYELLRTLVDTEIWLVRTDQMAVGSAYGVAGEIVRRAANVSAGDTAEARWAGILGRIARRVESAHVDRIATFVGELAGTPRPGPPPVELLAARNDPALLRDQVERAWEEWLRAECRVHPVLILVEDLHWGDAPSVGLLDHALRELADQPLCVIGMARPEIHDLFPGLWAERNVQVVKLGELSRRSAERLVREALKDRAPSDALVGRIVDRAGGNAFYLEELIRAVAEGREHALPETVLAMATARLEALDGEDRRILRAASVFGLTSWRSAMVALLGGAENTGQISTRLQGLVARELLTLRRDTRFPGEPEYTFRHALVREAAYASLTGPDRTLGHYLAAEWLETMGETDERVLAEHWERASDRERAAEHWGRAARNALRASDFATALDLAERGARGVPTGGRPDPAGAARQGEMRLVQAEAHRWLAQFQQAAERAADALERLPRGSRSWVRAAAERADAASHLGDTSVSVALGEELLTVAEADLDVGDGARLVALLLHDAHFALADRLLARLDGVAAARPPEPGGEAQLELARSYRALYRGDTAGSLAHDRRVVALFRVVGDEKSVVRFTNSVAYDLVEIGRPEEAIAVLEEAIPRAEQLRLGVTPSVMRQNQALGLARAGRLAEGIALQRQALAELEKTSDRRFAAGSRTYLAMALLDAGEVAEALACARRAAEETAYSGTAQATALAVLADCLGRSGRSQEALEVARRAYDWLTSGGAVEEGEARVRLAWVRALRGVGRVAEAAAARAVAADRLRERAAGIPDPELRRSFLEGVPDHAETLAP